MDESRLTAGHKRSIERRFWDLLCLPVSLWLGLAARSVVPTQSCIVGPRRTVYVVLQLSKIIVVLLCVSVCLLSFDLPAGLLKKLSTNFYSILEMGSIIIK